MSRRQTTSNTYRFFVAPDAFRDDTVLIEDDDLVRQLTSVLRLGAGDRIVLLDGTGWQHTVVIESAGRGRVAGQVEQRERVLSEPKLELTIAAGLMRAERFEWLLQKGTELGAAAFIPVLCERSISEGGAGAAKQARWARIIREAAEQSRRGILPRLEAPLPYKEACKGAAGGPALLLWEGQGAMPIRSALEALAAARPPAALTTLSGPEGGLTDAELELASSVGIPPVTLGPRTLRAETAPLAAAAAAMYAFGEMGGF
jgi:16S rRNA (uracil1498-N3)-methyltransferase